ncbi:fas-binding factor 1 isoform X2 [Apus apus]|uniref:fas-binding factor 1 isoform X2 n=1 Tax=Apus apus TaxID=8895 RepID=UPI0021F81C98|nr:fas-binding factor 1 isoform X2 [Apus apus]
MAAKSKKSLRGSIDDLLGDLLGYDDEPPVTSAKASQPARSSGGRAQGTSSEPSKKSFPEDDFFSKLPAEDEEAAEGSGASDTDPQAVLQTLKDLDDMEADLLGISKPGSGPGENTVKGPRKRDSLGDAVKTAGKLLAPEKGDSVPAVEKKPLSSPGAPRQYKKFNFEVLSSDEEKDAPKKPAQTDAKSSSKKTEESKEKEPPLPTAAPVRRREELTFEDDGDDLMEALGLGNGTKGEEKQGKKMEEEELQPAHFKPRQGSVAKILEPPGTRERREFKLEKEEGWNEEDFVFGVYQPTVASTLEGQSSRRQAVRYRQGLLRGRSPETLSGKCVTASPCSRFSAESSREPKPEPSSKPPPPARQSSLQSSGAGGDWLGLKHEEFIDLEPPSPAQASPAALSPSQPLAAEDTAAKLDLLEEENWLSAALSRKKAQAKAQERHAKPLEAPRGGLDPHSPVSQPAASTGAPQQAAVLQDKAASTDSSRQLVPWLSTTKQASAHPSQPAKVDPSRDTSTLVPTALFLGEQETQDPAPLAQVTAPKVHLQAAPQLQAEPPALGLQHEKRLGASVAQLCEDVSGCQGALISAQRRVAELESQVQMLEQERMQHKLLLESLQQRHQEDLDLLKSTHRSQVKVVEETYRQREERLQQEKEQLVAQLQTQRQDKEQATAELVAQHQQRVATLEQQKVLEVERLQELQRVSVQEMRKDYEEQLQRLKWLKDQEVDAVTSATSHTRSLNTVIEQIEKFSRDLRELLQKVETLHHTTSQELDKEARQRDRQHKALQDRLSQQQRDMEEERSRFQEVIAKMEARLGEQTRLLEQERWKATAEQSKLESLQHSLEEQRRVTAQQLALERAELERAKSTLLEEQTSVMQKCSEERRKLAAEWAEFHTQQQLSKERMERDVERARQVDSQREGTIVSLAKEQAELKIRGQELKVKEEQLARDRELQEEAWQELRREKEKVNRAELCVRRQEEELKSMARLSSQKHEEGERALREATRIESQHHSRLQVMQQHLEQLRQQEQRLHQMRQEWQSTAFQMTQPSNPMTLLTTGQDLCAPSRMLCFPPPNRNLPQHSHGDGKESLATANPEVLYAQLLLLKYRDQQDQDFLEEEEFFLESLK